MSEEKGNPFVGIAATLGGISVAIVAIIAIFAKEQLIVATWVLWRSKRGIEPALQSKSPGNVLERT